jgi:hypothetical protein
MHGVTMLVMQRYRCSGASRLALILPKIMSPDQTVLTSCQITLVGIMAGTIKLVIMPMVISLGRHQAFCTFVRNIIRW